MIVSYWDRLDAQFVDRVLNEERERRAFSADRQEKEDFVIAYEPSECFSVSKEKDCASIRDQQRFYDYISKNNVPVIVTHRGGGMIWHGPGQAILAPFVDIRRLRLDVTVYSEILERTCFETLSALGINGELHHYRPGAQGVWVKNKKIAFFGWSDSRGIAVHGCAINVSPDLYPFSLIDPCNLPGVEATSLEAVLGKKLAVKKVLPLLAEIFVQILKEKSGP